MYGLPLDLVGDPIWTKSPGAPDNALNAADFVLRVRSAVLDNLCK
jgi:hypothetical protein